MLVGDLFDDLRAAAVRTPGVLAKLHLSALGQDARRRFLAHDEHARDLPIIAMHRIVAVAPPDILDDAVAQNRHELIEIRHSAAARQYCRDVGADLCPDIGPERRS